MEADWKRDPRLKAMNPEKIKLLEHFADRVQHTEKNQLMQAFMAMNMEAKQRGLQFTFSTDGSISCYPSVSGSVTSTVLPGS